MSKVKQRQVVTIAGMAAAVFMGILLFTGQSAEAARCHTAASNIVKRSNISCQKAKKVVKKVYRRGGTQPECRGEKIKRLGWTVRGIGKPGRPIASKWKKGKRTFILNGGGIC